MTIPINRLLTVGRRQGVSTIRSGLAHIERRVEWMKANCLPADQLAHWTALHEQYPDIFTATVGELVPSPLPVAKLIDSTVMANFTMTHFGFPYIPRDPKPTIALGEHDGDWLCRKLSVGGKTVPVSTPLGKNDEWLLEVLRDQNEPPRYSDFFHQWTAGGGGVFTVEDIARMESTAPRSEREPVSLGPVPRYRPDTARELELRRIKGQPIKGLSQSDYRATREAVERGIVKASELSTDGKPVDFYTLVSTIMLELYTRPE